MCACMLFPGEASQQDLLWNNFRMGKHPEAHSRVHCISHTAASCYDSHPFLPKSLHLFITPPPPFHHFPSLTVIKGDSNGKSHQVTGGHLTSLVFSRQVCPPNSRWNPSCLRPDPCQPPPPVYQKSAEDWSALLEYCWKTSVIVIR